MSIIAGFSISEASLGPKVTIRSLGSVAAVVLCAGQAGNHRNIPRFGPKNIAFWGENSHFGLQIPKMDQIKKIKVVSDPVFNEDSGNTHPESVRPTVFALELCNDGLAKDCAFQIESPGGDLLFPR